jgi:hypothetical protein
VDVFGEVTVRPARPPHQRHPDHLSLLVLSGRTLDNDYQEDELVDLISRQRGLDFAPGTSFSYSNAGYFLLAEVVPSCQRALAAGGGGRSGCSLRPG